MYLQGPTLPLIHTSSLKISSLFRDTGGFDVLIGGFGFRLATDVQNPYVRQSEQTTAHRYDNSLEPGEQTLAPLPWVKSQSSFHAGAGQLNLEQGFSAFQYQQEQVEHMRFDTCLGVDPWTPGQLTRLPDCNFATDTLTALTANCSATAIDSSNHDCMVVGGAGIFKSLVWASGPDSPPTISFIDLSGADFGGASNCTVHSVTTDGTSYYASITLTTAVAGISAYVVKGTMGSAAAPVAIYDATAGGTVGWEKARLMAGLGTSIYELDSNATAHTALPAVVYTYPGSSWTWTATAESPNGILFAGYAGGHSQIIELALSTTGGTPTLTGGTTVARMPIGDLIYSLEDVLGSLLAIGTSTGIRVCSYTASGVLQQAPLSVTTNQPVYALTTRDRFVYGSFTNQQADGSTGLVSIDMSFVVDPAGRNAYAPSLRLPTTAPITHSTVSVVDILPSTARLVFMTGDGVAVEGGSPGSDGDAWLRTSRIRYDTVEPKLFKVGRIRGAFASSSVTLTAIQPYGIATGLGTFGFTTTDPGEFQLPGLSEWLQLEVQLAGATCVVNSYQVKAYPAPIAPELITMTLNCFVDESDRFGNDVGDPLLPRQRFQNLRDLKVKGDEIQLVEFTTTTPVVTSVLIDALQFQSLSPPTQDGEVGGKITIRLRTTEAH